MLINATCCLTDQQRGQAGGLPQLGADLPQLTVNQCGQAASRESSREKRKKYAKCWPNSGQRLDHKFPRRATLKRGKTVAGGGRGKVANSN